MGPSATCSPPWPHMSPSRPHAHQNKTFNLTPQKKNQNRNQNSSLSPPSSSLSSSRRIRGAEFRSPPEDSPAGGRGALHRVGRARGRVGAAAADDDECPAARSEPPPRPRRLAATRARGAVQDAETVPWVCSGGEGSSRVASVRWGVCVLAIGGGHLLARSPAPAEPDAMWGRGL